MTQELITELREWRIASAPYEPEYKVPPSDLHLKAADALERLTAERDALRADAMRYRFIRDGNAYIEPNHYDEDGKVTKEMYMALETGKYYADMRDFDMDIDAGISAIAGEKHD